MYLQDFLTLERSASDILANQKKDVEYAGLVIYFLRRTVVQLSQQKASQQLINNAINLQYRLAIYQNHVMETTLSKHDRRFDELDLLAIDAEVLNQRMLKNLQVLTVLSGHDKPLEKKDSDKTILSTENKISEVSDVRLTRPGKQKTLLLASRLGIEFGSD